MDELTAAYIGRFQPFAVHHRSVLQYIDDQKDVKEIIVIKGGAQWSDKNLDPYSAPSRNPFTVDECCEMVNLSLAGRIRKSYRIIKVEDTKTRMTDPLWKNWVNMIVEASGLNDFVVYANDSRLIRAFERVGIKCRPFPIAYFGLRATVVREKIAMEPEEGWSKYVDPEVADYIKKINGPERIRQLLEK